jgi:hypothetical protein
MDNWKLTLEHLIACNCDWGCPCIYEARPTAGYCEGLVAWKVLEGSIEGIDLSGGKWATAVKWPGAIHEMNGRAVVFVDDSATADQKPLIEALATGQAGGPLKTFMGTCTGGIDVRSGKVTWHFDGKRSSLTVEGSIALQMEAVLNPVTRDEHFVSVDLATGLMNQREDFFSSHDLTVNADGIKFNYSGRHAATSMARWTGP